MLKSIIVDYEVHQELMRLKYKYGYRRLNTMIIKSMKAIEEAISKE